MKKLLALMMLCLMVFTLTACQSGQMGKKESIPMVDTSFNPGSLRTNVTLADFDGTWMGRVGMMGDRAMELPENYTSFEIKDGTVTMPGFKDGETISASGSVAADSYLVLRSGDSVMMLGLYENGYLSYYMDTIGLTFYYEKIK